MTNIYAHLADGDAPKNQQITEVSFVDENGKHVDISSGTSIVTHDDTLAGSGTADSPLKISDTVTADIAKGKEITLDNIKGTNDHGENIPWNMAYVGTFNDNLVIRVAPSLTAYNYNREGLDLAIGVKNKINNAVQVSQLTGVTPLVNPESATTDEIATLLNQLINALKQQSQSAATNTPNLTESI